MSCAGHVVHCSAAQGRRSRLSLASSQRCCSSRAGVATVEPDVLTDTFIWRNQDKAYKICYEKIGSGPPVVVSHGFGSNARHFRRFAMLLSTTNTVYLPDLLGFGRSDKPSVPYTPALWASLLADFMASVVKEPAVVLGNSSALFLCTTSFVFSRRTQLVLKSLALLPTLRPPMCAA